MPEQSITAEVRLNDVVVGKPLSMTVKRAYDAKADMTTASVYSRLRPQMDTVPGTVFINGVQMASGELHNGEENGEGSYAFTFYNALRHLRQSTITASFENANIRDVITQIFGAAVVSFQFDLTPLTEVNVEYATDEDPSLRQYLVTEEFTDVPCLRALERVLQSVKWYWYVDRTNTVQIIDGFEYDFADEYPFDRLGNGDGLSLPTGRRFLIHDLEFVLDASPGKLTPSYQKVVVIGSASASGASTTRGHMATQDPIRGVATSEQFEPGDPTFTYRDQIIDSDENAQKAADAILDQFRAQQTGGWVEVVGHPYVRPFDVITMPEHLGGEQYLVADVEHHVADGITEGYITRIKCAGLVDSTPGEGGPATPSPFRTVSP